MISVLVENTTVPSCLRFRSEWGLSLHIEFNGLSILFDTGATGAFVENAKNLGIDLATVDAAVLSHHHFDHGGGLRRFLEVNNSAKVYLGPTPHGNCILNPMPFVKVYVGLDRTLRVANESRFVTIDRRCEVVPDVFVFPHIAGRHPRPVGNRYLYIQNGRERTLDKFDHEVVMAIKEKSQLVIFTGCSHSGVLNMIDRVVEDMPAFAVKAAIGGFHLVGLPPFNFMAESRDSIEALGRQLLAYPIGKTYTGHCTGDRGFSVLKSVMGERITQLKAVLQFEV